MSEAQQMKGMTPAQREEFLEARVLDQLNKRVMKETRIYFHHPKYGRFKHYPTKMTWTLHTHSPARQEIFNWINANIRGKWSIDEVERRDDSISVYNLSFEQAGDAIMFKLTLGHEQNH